MAVDGIADSFIAALHKPPTLLPIASYERDILYLLERDPILVIVGQTGSGKTTQVPQYLLRGGWCANGKLIAVTQVGLR